MDLNDLNFAQVWDAVEKTDTGCTPGGGKDSMNVFFDAGLLFESSTAAGTPYRQGDTISLFLPLNIAVKGFNIELMKYEKFGVVGLDILDFTIVLLLLNESINVVVSGRTASKVL